MLVDPILALPHLLEVAQVAHRLSASEEYVRRLIRTKKLPAIRLGARWRVDLVDLRTFIDAQRVQIAREEGRLDARLTRATGHVEDLQARRPTTAKASG